MKTTRITLTLIVVTVMLSYAEIKNGYSVGIKDARESLRSLTSLLNDGSEMTVKEKKTIQARLKAVENYIVYFELTESLLIRYRLIAPELYKEINAIKDKLGRSTDVYVKFIPGEKAQVQAWGTTNIAQVEGDEDAYLSEYGSNTVSVKIWAVDKALMVLSHELGHVKYQVPNLAEYMRFYKETYRTGVTDPNHIGHGHIDPSGQSAVQFDRVYREVQSRYVRSGNDLGDSTSTLKDLIRKEIHSSKVQLTGI